MFDKLKRLFIVEDESAKSKDAQPSSTPKTDSSGEVPTISSTMTTSVDTSDVGPSNKFTEILLGAMDARNSEGFDYLEFKESLNSLSKMNMDEATKFKSAFAMAQTMGASSDKLISTAHEYKNILGSEQQKFNQALENQKAKQITEVQQGISTLEQGIASKQKRIEEIQQEIEASEQKLEAARKNLEGAGNKIANTKEGFMASLAQIIGQLDGDIEKMEKYLK